MGYQNNVLLKKQGRLYNAFWTNATVRLPFEGQNGSVQGMYMPLGTVALRVYADQETQQQIRNLWLVWGVCTLVVWLCGGAQFLPKTSQTKRALLASCCIAAPCVGGVMILVTHYLLFFSRQGRRYLAAKVGCRKSRAGGYGLGLE